MASLRLLAIEIFRKLAKIKKDCKKHVLVTFYIKNRTNYKAEILKISLKIFELDTICIFYFIAKMASLRKTNA